MIRLTRSAEAIAAGKLDTELIYTNPSESNDELDHLYHATNLLKEQKLNNCHISYRRHGHRVLPG